MTATLSRQWGEYRDLLRGRRQFTLVWLGQVVSLGGDWFNTVALITLLNRYTDNSTLTVTLLLLARNIPFFLLSPVAGTIADMFDRKKLIVFTNLLRMFLVLGFLLVDSAERIWLIYLLTVIQFSLWAFFEPAFAAFLPSLVKQEELVTANTLNGVTWSVMLAVGSALGGFVVEVAGITLAFILDAASFALAAGLTYLAQAEFAPPPPPQRENYWQVLAEGLRYTRGHFEVGVLVFLKAFAQIGSIDAAIAIYSDQVFPRGEDGATTIGLLYAAFGIGAILGPLLADMLGDQSEASLQNWLTIGLAMIAGGIFIMGVAPSLEIAMLGVFLRGMGGSINWTYSTILIQVKVPNDFLGRVFGLDFALFTLTSSGGVLFAWVLFDALSLPPLQAMLIIAGLGALPTLYWFRITQQWRARAAIG
jgi:MFS family permease